MKHRQTLLALLTGVTLASMLPALGARSAIAQQNQSIWSGVYTAEQAARGEALYEISCAGCHGLDLSGGDEAPMLSGGEFVWNWNGITVGTLFERIRKTMPVEDPASVSRQEKADILAFMFAANEFPAGDEELASRTSILERILVEALEPSRRRPPN